MDIYGKLVISTFVVVPDLRGAGNTRTREVNLLTVHSVEKETAREIADKFLGDNLHLKQSCLSAKFTVEPDNFYH